jgi:hypothetical protein
MIRLLFFAFVIGFEPVIPSGGCRASLYQDGQHRPSLAVRAILSISAGSASMNRQAYDWTGEVRQADEQHEGCQGYTQEKRGDKKGLHGITC